jgi:hypothetical protein
MAAVAAEGEADAKAQMASGQGGRYRIQAAGVTPGRVSGHVVGRVQSLTGKPWAVTAVVSVNNRGYSKKQGTSLMAAAATVEAETHAFRTTKSRLRKARAVNQAELLKGIN